MKHSNESTLENVLDSLLTPYKESVTDVAKITNAMLEAGIIENEKNISNDHIAFRTLGVKHLGIASFEKIFLHFGYEKKGFYNFEEKKLNAYWYAPPAEHFPRIFISELRVNDLSEKAQDIIYKYTDPIPSSEEYTTLLNETEYAAWVIYNRYYLNHYTISVHDLPEGYNTVEDFNNFLEGIQIKLNTAGGKVKISADGLLKQSSTVAKMIDATFSDNKTLKIAGSYVEFAERKLLPEYSNTKKEDIKRNYRRDGFETANADKIFESTYTGQTK